MCAYAPRTRFAPMPLLGIGAFFVVTGVKRKLKARGSSKPSGLSATEDPGLGSAFYVAAFFSPPLFHH